MTGKTLGRYELLEQLGEGGMGAVWLARLSGSGGFVKLCIVKTVLPSIATDAEFVSRFLHEGRVLTQLSHGNIAQVLDMNEADGQLFLALEYVAGVDLSRLHAQVRERKEFMPAALVVALIAQAAEGLGSAHRKHALDGTPLNIVHRDVSPQNIMVSYEGEVKVIDFGIARSEARSRHTAQASVMGKLGYMAPEQARGEHVDHRADQYALGIVLWELLSNEAFVRRGTLTEMVVAMAAPSVRPLAPLRPDVPAALEAVVLKALSPLPNGRFDDTDGFAQALTAQLHSLGSTPTKPQLGEYVRKVCEPQFKSQQVLLSRVATIRSPTGQSPQLVSAALADTAMRPGEPMPERKVDVAALTSPGRPSSVNEGGATIGVGARGRREVVTPGAMPTRDGTAAVVRRDDTAPMEPTIAPAGGVVSAGSPAVVRREGSTTLDGIGLDATVLTPSPRVVVGPVDLGSSPLTPDSGAGSVGGSSSALTASSGGAVAANPAVTGTSAALTPSPDRLDVTGGARSRVSATGATSGQMTENDRAAVARPEADGLTTSELAAARGKRSPVALIAISVVVIGLAVAVAFSFRGGEATPAVVVDAGVVEVVRDAGVAPVTAVVPVVPEPVDAGVVAPPVVEEAEAQPSLRLSGRRAGGGAWVLSNQNRTNWTKCVLTVPGQRVAKIGTVPKGASLEVADSKLRFEATARVLSKQFRVDCAEGFGAAAVR